MKKSLVLAMAMALGVASSAFAAEINDKLEINGEVRANYMTEKVKVNDQSYESALRTRLEFVYKPVEDWKIVAMAENEHDIRAKRGSRHHDVVLKQAYVEGKYDQVDITIGRVGIGIADGNVLDDDLERMDSVQIGHDISDKVRIEAFMAQNLDGHEMQFEQERSKMTGARLIYAPAENTEIKAEYARFRNLCYVDSTDTELNAGVKIFALSVSHEIAKDLTANAVYIRGNGSGSDELKATSKNGYVLGLSYRGAEAEEKGSWGLNAHYYNQGEQTYVAHAIDGNTEFDGGFKGWSVGADYAIAKNLVAEVTYYDTKAKEGSDRDKRLWSALTWTF